MLAEIRSAKENLRFILKNFVKFAIDTLVFFRFYYTKEIL